MAHSPEQGRRRTYAEIIRSKIRTADNPTGRPIALRDLAKALGYSYEHLRKCIIGEPVVSKELNEKLCAYLALDSDSMFEQMEREKIARRWKHVPHALRPLPGTPLAEVWAQLSEADRELLTRIANALAHPRREAEALAAAREGKRPTGAATQDVESADASGPALLLESGPAEPKDEDEDFDNGFSTLRLHLRGGAEVAIPLAAGQDEPLFLKLQERDVLPPPIPFVEWSISSMPKYSSEGCRSAWPQYSVPRSVRIRHSGIWCGSKNGSTRSLSKSAAAIGVFSV